MTTDADSTKQSLACQKSDGNGVQLSEQGAVAPCSTPTEKPSSDIVIKILCSMLQRLLFETPARDAVILAFYSAENEMVNRQGISQEHWDYVQAIVLKQYEIERRKNPISGMF